jgi:hypothetical protein
MTYEEFDKHMAKKKRKQEAVNFAPYLIRLPLSIIVIVVVLATAL